MKKKLFKTKKFALF